MKDRIKSLLKSFLSNFQQLPNKVRLSIPYYSQWESIDLVDKILNHSIEAKDDPKWKSSGAKSKNDYQYWSWNLCGTACLKMILKYSQNKEFKLFNLAQKITSYGGYVPKKDGTIDGLFYKPFLTYLDKELEMKGEIANPLSLKRIKYEISRNNFVIVSVNQTIRNEKAPTPKTKTGHLLLVTGFDQERELFYLNNPSGYYKKSQVNHELSFQDFLRFYSGRGIIIENRIQRRSA